MAKVWDAREEAPPGTIWAPDFARREGVSNVQVIQYCDRGIVPGAIRIFSRWYIPERVRFVRNELYSRGAHGKQTFWLVKTEEEIKR